ncbi:MAG: mechanosensitive ion channel [Burkholderiaceae bacterium]|nr:mechanosensitive ion channel [Burkholderiaceae bacterium]
MKDAPLGELVQAFTEGLARPHHFWSLIAIALAVAGARVVSSLVRRRTQARLQATEGPGGMHVDALRFSIDGFRRLAFPLAAQALLWGGEAVLRLAGQLTSTADARLLRLAMTLFAAMAVIRLVVYVLRRVLKNVALIATFERVIALTIWLVFALHVTGWLHGVVEWLEATTLPIGKAKVSLWVVLMGAVSVLITLLASLWLGSSIEARLMRATSLDSNVRAVLSRVLRAVLVLVAVLVALSVVGIDLTVLSVFGGALGVGLGLGLQRIASNYVSGFIILLDRSLRIGDTITVDKYSGTVTRINTRYTVVRAADGTEAIVPNEMLIAQPVTNHSASDKKVRLAVKVSVGYDADVRQAMQLMEDAALTQARVLLEPKPAAALVSFGADGLDLEVGFWIRDPEEGRINVQSGVALAIFERFKSAGLGIPYPQREVRVSGLPLAPDASAPDTASRRAA